MSERASLFSFLHRPFNGPDKLTRFYYFVGDLLGDFAKHLTYKGGERSPRWLVERTSDYFTFQGVFRYQRQMERASFDEFYAYVGRRYGRGN